MHPLAKAIGGRTVQRSQNMTGKALHLQCSRICGQRSICHLRHKFVPFSGHGLEQGGVDLLVVLFVDIGWDRG